ncbi:MAG: hypothetical protein DMD67_16915 [Gemmatimonadetes bacterium]|nr:MAG: hypothetical protein DMD67_16915 [Gemmatimonadota bacterium]
MLQIDLRELARGPVDTRADVPGTDPLFEGVNVELSEPVRVAGRLQDAGDGRFYWRGSLTTRMAGQCRRCLAPVPVAVTAHVDALFSRDPDALEDPSSYLLAPDATAIDLRPAVREELCPRCGKDLNAGPCSCPPAVDQRWHGLVALRDKLRD